LWTGWTRPKKRGDEAAATDVPGEDLGFWDWQLRKKIQQYSSGLKRLTAPPSPGGVHKVHFVHQLHSVHAAAFPRRISDDR
jgi:hypothetical protein